jgi:hypothetical protein
MSLATDSIFVTALQSDTDLLGMLGYVAPTESDPGKPARLYSTAIPLPDEKLENVPVPYAIVRLDGINNEDTTKDDDFESDEDSVSISILVSGRSRKELADVAQSVRSTIQAYMITKEDDEDFPITEYRFSADGVQYDPDKPCYWQVLRYACDVINLIVEEDEQD